MTNSVYLLGGKTGNMTVITAAMNDVIDFETKLIQVIDVFYVRIHHMYSNLTLFVL